MYQPSAPLSVLARKELAWLCVYPGQQGPVGLQGALGNVLGHLTC